MWSSSAAAPHSVRPSRPRQSQCCTNLGYKDVVRVHRWRVTSASVSQPRQGSVVASGRECVQGRWTRAPAGVQRDLVRVWDSYAQAVTACSYPGVSPESRVPFRLTCDPEWRRECLLWRCMHDGETSDFLTETTTEISLFHPCVVPFYT